MRKYLISITFLISVVLTFTIIYQSESNSKNYVKGFNTSTKLPLNGISPILQGCTKSSDEVKCFTTFFNATIGKFPSKVLVNQLYLYREEVPTALQYCHDTALRIGYQAWGEYKNLTPILTFGTPVCASGFLHGVQEAIGLDSSVPASSLVPMVSQICEKITNNDFRDSNYRVCYHGIGHAVAKRVNLNYQAGIKYCNLLSNKIDNTDTFDQSYTKRELCAEGLTMRYSESIVNRVVLVKPGNTASNNIYANPYNQCSALTDKSLRYGCFEYTTRAFTHTPIDYLREGDLCNLYALNDEVPCYFGISRELAYTSTTDTIKNVSDYCARAKYEDAAFYCGSNAILNRVTIDNNANTPVLICNLLPKNALDERICSYVKEHLHLTVSENSRTITH